MDVNWDRASDDRER